MGWHLQKYYKVILCAITKVAEVVNEGGKILLQMVKSSDLWLTRKEEQNRYKWFNQWTEDESTQVLSY